MSGYGLKANDGWKYGWPEFVVKAGEADSMNGATFVEYTTSKGREPGDHTHPTEDEMFYVLEGELTFRCGDDVFDIGPGGFVFLPRGVKHGFTIRSEGDVRFIIVTAPPRPTRDGWKGFVGESQATGLVSSPGE